MGIFELDRVQSQRCFQPPKLPVNPKLEEHPFQVVQAHALAELAGQAYFPLTEAGGGVLGQWGFENGQWFEQENSAAFTCESEQSAVVAFRGTQGIGDLIDDANFVHHRHPWGRVHSGFVEALGRVLSDVEAFAERVAGSKPLWLTGHSLGGAMAVLFGSKLQSLGVPARIATFGQPRVGDTAFARNLERSRSVACFRVVHPLDPVPRLPPALGYAHAPERYELSIEGLEQTSRLHSADPSEDSAPWTLLKQPEEPEPMTRNQIADLLVRGHVPQGFDYGQVGILQGRFPALEHHAIARYVRLLRSARTR